MHQAPMLSQHAQPAASYNVQRIVIVSASGAGALGTFLPWVSIGAFGSAEGTHGDGWITLGLFAVTFLVALLGNRREAMSTGKQVGILVPAIACAVAALYDLTTIRALPIASVGGGLYLVTIASLVVVGAIAGGRRLLPGLLAVFAAAATIFLGFAHIPYGSQLPKTKLCAKTQWSLRNTFPNIDDYIGKPIKPEDTPTVEALLECGVLEKNAPPPAVNDDEARTPPAGVGPSCTVPNAGTVGRRALGHCEQLANCTTPATYYQGFCEGPADVICCVRN